MHTYTHIYIPLAAICTCSKTLLLLKAEIINDVYSIAALISFFLVSIITRVKLAYIIVAPKRRN